MAEHLIDGEFQSDKYPTTPRGKVPLSCKDPAAQDLLWEYAQRRRAVDAAFSADLEEALRLAGYQHDDKADWQITPRMLKAAWVEARRWWPYKVVEQAKSYTVKETAIAVDEPQPGFREAITAAFRARFDV